MAKVLEPREVESTGTPPPLPVRNPLRDRPLYRRYQTMPGLSNRSFTPSPSFRNAASSGRSDALSEGGQETAQEESSEGSLSERCTLMEFLISEAGSTASSPIDHSIDARTLSPSSSMHDHRVRTNGGKTKRVEEESEQAVSPRGDYGIETSRNNPRWSASSSDYSISVERDHKQVVLEHEGLKLNVDLVDDYNEETSETNSTISSYDRGRPSSYQHDIIDEEDDPTNQERSSDKVLKADTSHASHRPQHASSQKSMEEDNDARTEAWLTRGLVSPKSSGTLSLFPPLSPSSGNREYVASTVSSNSPKSPLSPLNNGRDAYGNWIDSNTMHSPKARPALQKEQSVPHLRGGWGRFGGLWGDEETEEGKGNAHHLVVGEEKEGQQRGRSQTMPNVSRSQTAPDIRSQVCGNSRTTFTPRHRPALHVQTGASIKHGRDDAGDMNRRPPGPPRDDDYDDLSAIFNKYFGVAASPTSPTAPDMRSPTSPVAFTVRPPTAGNMHVNKYVTPGVQETSGLRSLVRGLDNAPRRTREPSNTPRSLTKATPNTSTNRSAYNDQQYSPRRPQHLQIPRERRPPSPELRSLGRNLNIGARPDKRWDKPPSSPPCRHPPAPPSPPKPTHQHPTKDTNTRSVITYSDQKSIDTSKLHPLDKEIFSSGVYTSHLSRVRAEKERKARETAQARWLAEREREKMVLKKREEERKRRLAPLVAQQAREQQRSVVETVASEDTTISPSDSVSNRMPNYHGPAPRRQPPRRDPPIQVLDTLVEQDVETPLYGRSGGPENGVRALHNRLAAEGTSTNAAKLVKENMNSLEMGLHITGKVVRFLLAVPSDPKLKTYSRRAPPEDILPSPGPRPVLSSTTTPAAAAAAAAAAQLATQREKNIDTAPPPPNPPHISLWSHISKKTAKAKGKAKTQTKPPFPKIHHTTLSGSTAVNSSTAGVSRIPFPSEQRHGYTHAQRGRGGRNAAVRRAAVSIGESTIPEMRSERHRGRDGDGNRDGNTSTYAPSEAPTAWPDTDSRGDVRVQRQDGVLGLRGGGGDGDGDGDAVHGPPASVSLKEVGEEQGQGQREAEEGGIESLSRFSTDSSDEEEEVEADRKVVEDKAMVFAGRGLGWVG